MDIQLIALNRINKGESVNKVAKYWSVAGVWMKKTIISYTLSVVRHFDNSTPFKYTK